MPEGAGDDPDDASRQPDGVLDPDDFTYEELADIDARAKSRVRAEPVEPVDDDYDDDGKIIDPRKAWRRRPTFSERVAVARHEEATGVAREKIASAMTREWFTKASQKKTEPPTVQEETKASPSAQSPTPRSGWGWLRARFATPKKPVWK